MPLTAEETLQLARRVLPALDPDELKFLDNEGFFEVEGSRIVRYSLEIQPDSLWSRLHTELRSRIFEFAIAEDDKTQNSKTPSCIALVCREWYADAMRTPRLWATVVIRGHSWLELATRIPPASRQLGRARSAPVWYYIILPPGHGRHAFATAQRIIMLVCQHFDHLECLTIKVYGGVSSLQLVSCLQLPAPMLTDLRIFRPQWPVEPDTSDVLPAGDFLGRAAPQLHSFFFPSLTLDWPAASFQHITTLSLTDRSATSSLQTVLALFRLPIPCLTNLEIFDFILSPSDDPLHTFLNSSIKELTLRPIYLGDALVVLDRLDLPALESLVLFGTGASPSPHRMGVTSSQFIAIISLIFRDRAEDSADLRALLRRLSRLRSIAIRDLKQLQIFSKLDLDDDDDEAEKEVLLPILAQLICCIRGECAVFDMFAVRFDLMWFLTRRAGRRCEKLKKLVIPHFGPHHEKTLKSLLKVEPDLKIEVRWVFNIIYR